MVNYYAVDKKQLDEQWCENEAINYLQSSKGIIVDHFNPVTKPNTKKTDKVVFNRNILNVKVNDDTGEVIEDSDKLSDEDADKFLNNLVDEDIPISEQIEKIFPTENIDVNDYWGTKSNPFADDERDLY